MTDNQLDPGRRHQIVTRALAIAIAAIERAAPQLQPLSDLDDMKSMLADLVGPDVLDAVYTRSSAEIVKSILVRH